MRHTDSTVARGLAAAIFAALIGAGSGALAQSAPALDSAKLAAAKALSDAQGGIEQARKALTQMTAAMVAELRRTRPDEADGFAKFMATYVGPGNEKVTRFFEDVQQASIEFYAARCSVEELKAMTEFLKAPAGQKFVSLAPEASQIIAPRFIRFQQELMADVQAAAQRGEFKK